MAAERSGPLNVLGVETSCDETSAAVLCEDDHLRSHVIHSQDAHRAFGGVVPEIASRAHLRVLDGVVGQALDEAGMGMDEVDLFAVTAGPGLIGALLVGVCWAKAAAWSLGRPIVGVHHMEGHLFAARLEHPDAEPPFVALLVSGGHTLLLHVPEWGRYERLGATRDDAAGEAFDKAAKILELPYPGGPSIERAAREGDPARFPLPRPLLKGGRQHPGYLDFSFSGLKTALRTQVRELAANGGALPVADLAASFQAAAVETMAEKTRRALRETGCRRVVVGGGVANNRALREAIAERSRGAQLFFPSPRLSTDNAAMIARAGLFRYRRGERGGTDLSARADLPFPGLVDRRPADLQPA
jgi:N6-L-threonylcarbamoyladenine synthase